MAAASQVVVHCRDGPLQFLRRRALAAHAPRAQPGGGRWAAPGRCVVPFVGEDAGKPWENMEKYRNIWKNFGKTMGKHGKTKGKPSEKVRKHRINWKNHGKTMEKLWENIGKFGKTLGKTWKNYGETLGTDGNIWDMTDNH